MTASPHGTVLVSGASIAGPTLAYWLHRRGFDVTVVEKAGAVRGGGYPIDVRGTALGVVERMGLLAEVRAAHTGSRRLTFLAPDGTSVGTLGPESVGSDVVGRDVELPRGTLTELLYGAVRDDVEFVFDDSIATLEEDDGGVAVSFTGGVRRRFDYAVGDVGQVHGFLTFTRDTPPFDAFRDPRAQRDLVAGTFAADDVWEVPRLVAAMRAADDVFFDVVSQIRMPRWSAGRVVLVGDAAHAPSFLSGQGSSLALVGAYVLAGELAAAPSYREGFERYERRLRAFVAQNQALADGGSTVIVPRTAEELARRNAALRSPGRPASSTGEAVRRASIALDLPSYPEAA
jgi:2-polyprenyl-6-methoxyphenol hydroxylase-like FAD-dependent oxidoreductase